MQVPFHKPYVTDDEIGAVVEAIRSGWLTMGPRTVEFEKRFRGYIFDGSGGFAVAVASGTAALHLALRAAGIKAGDEVIIPTNTFTATGEVVTYFGAKPVLCDVERDTHNIDVSKVESLITEKTRAIVPVHFAGQPCDMDEITQLAGKYGLVVVEDAAHALPAWYRGEKIGTIGDATCFSFYATKTLCTGEGGMVTTKNDNWARKIKVLRLHGISRDAWDRYTLRGSWYYEVVESGYKYNMTDIQAAMGLVQLGKLEWMWERRRSIAQRYTQAFEAEEAIISPVVRPDRESAWHLYVIKLRLEVLRINREGFIEELKKRGVGTSVHFIPLHRHPYYRDTLGCSSSDFPEAEWVYERCVSLPIYPGMKEEELDYVIGVVLDVCKSYKR